MPALRRPPPPRRAFPATAVLVGAAVVILLVAGGVAWRGTRRPAPPAPVDAVAVPAPSPPEPPAPPPDPRPALLAARATLTCAGGTGEVVFVSPERALGSLECPDGQAQVHLPDGRDLLGRPVPGAPPGTSILDVPGAAAPFVPLAWASVLPEGAPLLVGLDGAGLTVVGEATARGIAFAAGRAFLRVEEAAGPVAGPVSDAAGNLVGVVPSLPDDPDRPGLAVPVEAFAGPLGREVPESWRTAVERAQDEERRAQGELWGRLRGPAPVLLAAVVGPAGLDLFVARAGVGRPPAESVVLELSPAVPGCTIPGRIVEWSTGPRILDGTPVPPPVIARLGRVAPPQGGGSIWLGRGQADFPCDVSRVADGATLAVPGTDPVAPVPFPRADLAEVLAEGARRTEEEDRRAAQAAAQDQASRAEEEAAREMGWRDAFRQANARVAQAKEQVRLIEADRDAARGNFQYVLEEQLNADLEVARLEVRRAEMALDDLDRRASLDAVPREWRRE